MLTIAKTFSAPREDSKAQRKTRFFFS